MTTKKPTRRPRHAYSPELTDLICERLLDGTSLRQICQDKNMPARSSLFVWLAKYRVRTKLHVCRNPPRRHARRGLPALRMRVISGLAIPRPRNQGRW